MMYIEICFVYIYKDSHKRAKKMGFVEKNRMNGWLVEEDNNKNVYEGTKKRNKRFTFISFYSEIGMGIQS